VLGVEHPRDLRVVERCEDALGPRRELRLDAERGLAPGVAMRIAQSGERLVEGIPRRPEAVEIERGGADVTLRQRRECLAAASSALR
jgi:hypothetical protein